VLALAEAEDPASLSLLQVERGADLQKTFSEESGWWKLCTTCGMIWDRLLWGAYRVWSVTELVGNL